MEILQGPSKSKNSKESAVTKPDAEEDKSKRPATAAAGQQRPQRPKPGMNCIKIGLPGKSILRDYFQENMTSQRPFLCTENQFSRKTFFYTISSRGLRDCSRRRGGGGQQRGGEVAGVGGGHARHADGHSARRGRAALRRAFRRALQHHDQLQVQGTYLQGRLKRRDRGCVIPRLTSSGCGASSRKPRVHLLVHPCKWWKIVRVTNALLACLVL